ncbi:MAG: dipeptidase [Acidobacteriota bacterium]
MMRHPFVLAACIAALASRAHAEDLASHARRLLRESLVVDPPLDAPDQLSKKPADSATRGATSHFDLPRAREGGLTAPFFSIYVSAAFADHGAAKRALELIDLTRRVVADHPADTMLASSVADIRAAKRANKLAILMGIEGGHAIEDSLGVLREMYRAGVRYMTLTHINTNHWADSSGPFFFPDFDPKQSAVHHGLTPFGKDVVREMNRLGMIVDISHTSDETVEAVLAVSRAPVMASHSSCRALVAMPRDLTDDQIRRIAAKGGVVMINVGSSFLDQKAWDAFVRLRSSLKAEWTRHKKGSGNDSIRWLFDRYEAAMKAHPPPAATVGEVADHIEHVIEVAGIAAVGLGSDFDGIDDPPAGFEDYSKLPALVEELLRRGHSDADIKKILGENFLAFFARVEATRDSLANEKPLTTEMK